MWADYTGDLDIGGLISCAILSVGDDKVIIVASRNHVSMREVGSDVWGTLLVEDGLVSVFAIGDKAYASRLDGMVAECALVDGLVVAGEWEGADMGTLSPLQIHVLSVEERPYGPPGPGAIGPDGLYYPGGYYGEGGTFYPGDPITDPPIDPPVGPAGPTYAVSVWFRQASTLAWETVQRGSASGGTGELFFSMDEISPIYRPLDPGEYTYSIRSISVGGLISGTSGFIGIQYGSGPVGYRPGIYFSVTGATGSVSITCATVDPSGGGTGRTISW